MQSLSLLELNCGLHNGFVNMSATCSWPGTCARLIIPAATFSRMKCISILMCFVRWWKTEFLAMQIALILFECRYTTSCSPLFEERQDPCDSGKVSSNLPPPCPPLFQFLPNFHSGFGQIWTPSDWLAIHMEAVDHQSTRKALLFHAPQVTLYLFIYLSPSPSLQFQKFIYEVLAK